MWSFTLKEEHKICLKMKCLGKCLYVRKMSDLVSYLSSCDLYRSPNVRIVKSGRLQ
jgi:hypothetical protein